MPPRVARDPEHDLEEPRPRPVSTLFELVPAAMGDDEHLLGAIFHVALGYAKAAKVTPDEVDVLVVERPEITRAHRRRGRDVDQERIERRTRMRRLGNGSGGHLLRMAARHLFCHAAQAAHGPHQSPHDSASSRRAERPSPNGTPPAMLIPATPRSVAARLFPSCLRTSKAGPNETPVVLLPPAFLHPTSPPRHGASRKPRDGSLERG